MIMLRTLLPCIALLFIPYSTAIGQLTRINANASEGLSAAVAVDHPQLVHTTQLFAFDDQGDLVGHSTQKQLEVLLRRVESIAKEAGGSRSNVVKLNFYVADSSARTIVQKKLGDWFGAASLPAVSFVATPLPQPGAIIAVDAVIAAEKQIKGATPRRIRSAEKKHAVATHSPTGDLIYISGQAEPGELAEATTATLASLLRTLESLDLDRSNILSLKCFLTPMSKAGVVDDQIAQFFNGAVIPPVSHVEWISGSRPIEIELIAAAPPSEGKETVSYFAAPGLKQSPVYSRVTRLHGNRRIYISGLLAHEQGDGKAQTADIFRQLQETLAKAGSDMRHLAKATYYVSDSDASSQLNAIRPTIYDPQRPPAASKALVPDVGASHRTLTIDMIAAPKSR